jgi:hypothetical protein
VAHSAALRAKMGTGGHECKVSDGQLSVSLANAFHFESVLSALCRGGFFLAPDADADNRRAVEEAAELGTDVLVLVCGPPEGRDLDGARAGSRPASSASCRSRPITASGSRSSRCTR